MLPIKLPRSAIYRPSNEIQTALMYGVIAHVTRGMRQVTLSHRCIERMRQSIGTCFETFSYESAVVFLLLAGYHRVKNLQVAEHYALLAYNISRKLSPHVIDNLRLKLITNVVYGITDDTVALTDRFTKLKLITATKEYATMSGTNNRKDLMMLKIATVIMPIVLETIHGSYSIVLSQQDYCEFQQLLAFFGQIKSKTTFPTLYTVQSMRILAEWRSGNISAALELARLLAGESGTCPYLSLPEFFLLAAVGHFLHLAGETELLVTITNMAVRAGTIIEVADFAAFMPWIRNYKLFNAEPLSPPPIAPINHFSPPGSTPISASAPVPPSFAPTDPSQAQTLNFADQEGSLSDSMLAFFESFQTQAGSSNSSRYSSSDTSEGIPPSHHDDPLPVTPVANSSLNTSGATSSSFATSANSGSFTTSANSGAFTTPTTSGSFTTSATSGSFASPTSATPTTFATSSSFATSPTSPITPTSPISTSATSNSGSSNNAVVLELKIALQASSFMNTLMGGESTAAAGHRGSNLILDLIQNNDFIMEVARKAANIILTQKTASAATVGAFNPSIINSNYSSSNSSNSSKTSISSNSNSSKSSNSSNSSNSSKSSIRSNSSTSSTSPVFRQSTNNSFSNSIGNKSSRNSNNSNSFNNSNYSIPSAIANDLYATIAPTSPNPVPQYSSAPTPYPTQSPTPMPTPSHQMLTPEGTASFFHMPVATEHTLPQFGRTLTPDSNPLSDIEKLLFDM